MNLLSRLDHLQDRLTTSLRQLPGATALYLFGSRATAHTDQYADIDLHILTADLPAARAVWPHYLEHVGPMEAALSLTDAAENTAFAILFREESYYHKVDISLSDANEPIPLFIPAASYTLLWSQPPASLRQVLPHTTAYIPSHNSVGHLVLDELVASVRYVRARKRGQDLTCWRFLRSKVERLLQLIADQMMEEMPRNRPLMTWDYKALDKRINTCERDQLIQHLNWSTPNSMDSSCYWFSRQIIDQACRQVLERNESFLDNIINRHYAFMQDELNIEEPFGTA